MLRDTALQLVDARAGLRRGDKDLLGGQFQLLADACQLTGLLGAAELVRLVSATTKLNSFSRR